MCLNTEIPRILATSFNDWYPGDCGEVTEVVNELGLLTPIALRLLKTELEGSVQTIHFDYNCNATLAELVVARVIYANNTEAHKTISARDLCS